MRKRFGVGVLCITILVLIFAVGCSKNKPTGAEQDDIVVITDPADSNDVVDTREDLTGKVPSPISGIYVEQERIERRPFAVMFDNMVKARPQAGLDQAEIVYEFLAEGLITRYMGIFLINEPDTIGSVRSARPYFIDRALEYDALYVHVGGSEQAKSDIKALKMADIDALSRNSTIFWRKSHKQAPHNMYTSTQAIRKAASESKYNTEGVYERLKFHNSDVKPNGAEISKVGLPYSKNYTAAFIYNQEEGIYYREINGKSHQDEISKQQMTAKNIIVQKAATKVIDSEGRLEIEMVGKGEGFYLTQGEMLEITWEKKSRKAITRYYDKDGKEIQLNPGITWIQVVPKTMNPIFE
ncbi:DUF3048 domain-containing protein [Geosporobacter ferrireducens]|uniref:DUF3048 domain-containing protein n=1 Tax=Geosporobacter ferrireducens TaxID=1424294 RepID=UPI00139CC740|nr:DUF3048 domain-containing protein [Geosporobacter ferrireducens]MTI53979.1 DUF3048 domain-containing protein [Geosporobacter ferrireducens]